MAKQTWHAAGTDSFTVGETIGQWQYTVHTKRVDIKMLEMGI